MVLSENIVPAVVLTLLAGLSTGIGSAIAYLIRKPRIVYLCFSLGLSAGVMIYVSFMELLPSALQGAGKFWGFTAFFIGIAVIGLIDILTPGAKNPHNYRGLDAPTAAPQNSDLMRTGMLTALAIGIHNLPEGMATFASALSDVRLGLFIAIAIALHNIPEGIAVSVPIFYATSSKNKAFLYSFLSGLSEPAGAVIAYLALLPFLTPAVLAATLAFVAGVMVYISLDELLPMAHRYGYGHVVIWGVVLGMLIMAVSLFLL
jgi:ZIP family zinc transporter